MTDWTGTELISFYQNLYGSYGSQHWWPADTPFEAIIGAILAQNVSWSGAHKAVLALKEADLMETDALLNAGPEIIASYIHSSRYYNQKAKKILTFLTFFSSKYKGSLDKMAASPISSTRKELLDLNGFGQETVDSILLYALNKPIFVVDAYTRRVGFRQGWFEEKASYNTMQEFFMTRIPPDVLLYNDFHAQIVYLGNQVCKKTPLCRICPVRKLSDFHTCEYPEKNSITIGVNDE